MKKDNKGIILTVILAILFIVSIYMVFTIGNSISLEILFVLGAIYVLGLINIFILEKGLPRTISKIIMSIVNISLIIFFLVDFIKSISEDLFWLIQPLFLVIILSIQEYFIIRIDKKTNESIRIWYIIMGIIILFIFLIRIAFRSIGP